MRFHPAPPPTAEELERRPEPRGSRCRSEPSSGVTSETNRTSLPKPIRSWRDYSPPRSRAGPRPAPAPVSGSCAFGDRVEIEGDEERLTIEEIPGLARTNGFSLHAGVAVPANDRQRLERLCRYVGRPPVASGTTERSCRTVACCTSYAIAGETAPRHVAFRAAGTDRPAGRAGAAASIPHDSLPRRARLALQTPCRRRAKRKPSRLLRPSCAVDTCMPPNNRDDPSKRFGVRIV